MKNLLMRLFLIIGVFAIAVSISLWQGKRFKNQDKALSSKVVKKRKKIQIKNLGKPKNVEVKTIDQIRKELDQKNNQPKIVSQPIEDDTPIENETLIDNPLTENLPQEDPENYESSDFRDEIIEEESGELEEIEYLSTDLVICVAYASDCEPKEIYETRDPSEEVSCLTTYAKCVDKITGTISYPMSQKDADIYIEKKLESFYQENY